MVSTVDVDASPSFEVVGACGSCSIRLRVEESLRAETTAEMGW